MDRIYSKSDIEETVRKLNNNIIAVSGTLKACADMMKSQSDRLDDLRECECRRIVGEFKAAFRERYAYEKADHYRRFFCDEGMLHYFARAYGYAECRLRRADTDAEKHWRYFAGECICPLQNRVILLRTGLRKHDESLNPLLEQEMNVNELNASPSLALLQERLNYLRDQVAERRADPNRLFYEQLWTLVEPFVKQLENVGFRPSESDFASVGFGSVSDFLHRLRDALRRGGLEVVCSPEECVAGTDEEDCFVVSRDAGFATPAIVRRSDGYVFVKGVRPAD